MYEILDNVVVEAQVGFPSKIDVVLVANDFVSIIDNGCEIRAKFEEDVDVMLTECDIIFNEQTRYNFNFLVNTKIILVLKSQAIY